MKEEDVIGKKLVIIDASVPKKLRDKKIVKITNDVFIPVKNNIEKRLWGFKTKKETIIPSFGAVGEILTRSKKGVLYMFCKETCVGSKDMEKYRKWLEDVFPPEIYENPVELAEISGDLLLVRPYMVIKGFFKCGTCGDIRAGTITCKVCGKELDETERLEIDDLLKEFSL